VQASVGSRAEYVYNAEYLTRNNWYSLLLGMRALPSDAARMVVLNGDLFAAPCWLSTLLQAAADTSVEGLLAIDFDRVLTDEYMKVAAMGDHLNVIGKHEFSGAAGEYVGLLMAAGSLKEQLRAELERFEGEPTAMDKWYEGAVGRVADAGGQWFLWPTPSSEWVEIDDELDLARAAELGLA
jgi:choline kinase